VVVEFSDYFLSELMSIQESIKLVIIDCEK